MKQLSMLAFIAMLLSACTKENQLNPDADPIDFSNLKVGQQSVFQQYRTSCDDPDGDFQYTGNKLLLEVTERNGLMYLTEELLRESPGYIRSRDNTLSMRIESQGDRVLIPERDRSRIFFFYANDTIWLQPRQQVQLIQKDCQLIQNEDPFIGNDIGSVTNFKVGEVDHRDKKAVSCVPMDLNIDAYLIYDEKQLYVSHVIYSSGIPSLNDVFANQWVEGWEIENQ